MNLDLMMERFVHDNSPFAQQYYESEGAKRKKGTYYFRVTNGTCTHTPKHQPKDCDNITSVIFTKQHMMQHLEGKKTYAPYQTSSDGKVKWLCIDIDAYEDAVDKDVRECVIAVAVNILSLVGKGHTLVEDSGSKGYHLWVFFDKPLGVGYAHMLGEKIVSDITPPNNTNIEIYPKHTQHRENFFGATVKLPLGIHQKTGKLCQFVDMTFKPHANQWKRLQDVVPIDSEWVIANVKAPPPKTHNTHHRTAYVPLCLMELLDVGVEEGFRDEPAFRIACYLRDKGIPERSANDMMHDWNARNNPPMDDQIVQRKVEQAYSSDYSWMPCHDNRMDRHCHSTCTFFERKVERRWFDKSQSPIGILSKD